MGKVIFRKCISILMVFVMTLTMTVAGMSLNTEKAYASSHTQAEAVAWANQRYYESWCVDYDGVNGCQCVDLIKYYCDYLGDAHGSFTTGNAYAYASNSLPAGWTRDSSPRAGDIFVCQPWKNGAKEYGHVGIVTEVRDSTIVYVNTNAGGTNGACTVAEGTKSNRTYIHPNFYSAPTQSTDGSEMSSGCDRTIPDGNYVIANASNPLYYLDVNGTAKTAANGTNVMLCKSESVGDVPAADAWTVEYNNGFYTISQMGTNRCLDVLDFSVKEGANVQVWENNGTLAQKWAISENGRNGFRIRAKCSGKSLDICNGNIASGENVWQYTGNESEAQSWVFIPYKPARTIKDGDYAIVNASNPLYYLDINGTEKPAKDRTNVMICKSEKAGDVPECDIWTVKYSNGYYTITQKGTNVSLDVYDASTKVGTNAWVISSNGTSAQEWAITGNDSSGYTIRSKCSGHALDILNGNIVSGENVQLWNCNNTKAQTWTFIPYVKDLNSATVSLNKTSYVYTGKAKVPSVTANYKGTSLTKGTDYTVSYSNNTKCGKAKVTIMGKGNYTGTITKYFRIIPAKAVLSKATAGSKKITVSIKSQKTSGVTGYQIYYKKSGSSAKTVTTTSTSKALTGLTKGKKYTVKVRAYKTIDGKKYYGAYSTSKTVTVK